MILLYGRRRSRWSWSGVHALIAYPSIVGGGSIFSDNLQWFIVKDEGVGGI